MGQASAPAPVGLPTALHQPVQLALRVGGVGRATAVDPRASLTALWQWVEWAGPIASTDFTGTLEPLVVGEGFAGAGAAFLWQPTAAVRTGVGLMGGAWTHGWYFADDDWGFAFDPAAIVPAWVDVRVVPGWHLSFAAEAGALGRDRIHRIQGAPVWSRGGFSLALSVGLTVDIPGPPSILEN